METLFDKYVLAGGPLMAVLLFCSLMLVAAIVQSMIGLRRTRVAPPLLLEKAERAQNKNDRIAYAFETGQHPSPLARVMRRVFREIDVRSGHRPHKRQLDPAIADSVAHVADDLYEKTGPFATIYTVAPLIGLLGTILGMMSAFNEFAAGAEKDLTALSQGIQQALVTTFWGLGIAIVAYIASQTFHNKIRRYEREELPEKAAEIVNALYGRKISPDELEAPDADVPPAAVSHERRAPSVSPTARPEGETP